MIIIDKQFIFIATIQMFVASGLIKGIEVIIEKLLIGNCKNYTKMLKRINFIYPLLALTFGVILGIINTKVSGFENYFMMIMFYLGGEFVVYHYLFKTIIGFLKNKFGNKKDI